MKIIDVRYDNIYDDDGTIYDQEEYVGIDVKKMFDINILLELEDGDVLVEEYYIDHNNSLIYIPRRNYDLYLILLRDKKIDDLLK